MRRSNFALAACLTIAVAAGSIGLSSCGGGKSGTGRASGPFGSGRATAQATIVPPENRLTGAQVTLQNPENRETYMRITPAPANAQWTSLNFDIDPFDAGEMCCYQSYAGILYVKFTCANGYVGDVTITTILSDSQGHSVEEAVQFTCR